MKNPKLSLLPQDAENLVKEHQEAFKGLTK